MLYACPQDLSAPDFVRDSFYQEVVREFPQMDLCDNFWKVDAVATARYSSWTQTHLKESNKRKVNTKSEPPEELGSPQPSIKKIKSDSDSSTISPPTSPMDLDTPGPSSSSHSFAESFSTSTTAPLCTSALILNAIIPDNASAVETVRSTSDTGSIAASRPTSIFANNTKIVASPPYASAIECPDKTGVAAPGLAVTIPEVKNVFKYSQSPTTDVLSISGRFYSDVRALKRPPRFPHPILPYHPYQAVQPKTIVVKRTERPLRAMAVQKS
ncbi:hypothetical protein BS17DRAFT_790158 [Gyrodon lividus]|nr:hypothetical protein BS17DRAFT_790158 [Gyrodon lividus]